MHGDVAQYANVAYLEANKAGVLETVEQELNTVATVLEDDNTRQYFNDPSVSVSDKQKALDAIADEAKFHEITGAVLALVNEDGAVSNVGEVSSAFGEIMSAHRGEVRATVTSADKLTKSDAKAIETALKKRLESGQTLVLTQQVGYTIYLPFCS